jgi:protein AroM
MKKIGMLTIGQSPRDDILPSFKEIMGEGFEIVETGALDHHTLDEIERVEFRPDDYILVSRMRDGTEIKITKRLILPLMQERIHELEERGVSLTVIMCTGKFPSFKSRGLVVTPQEIIKGVVKGALKRGKLGIVYPAKEQIHMAKPEFGREGIEIYADHVSPYEGNDEIDQLAERLAKQNLDLILLNCFGFSNKVKRVVAEKIGKPVIQANLLVARVIKELA